MVRPQPVKEVTWAKGIVPTPHGPVSAGWALAGRTLTLSLTVPQGTAAEVVLPRSDSVRVNGKPEPGQGLRVTIENAVLHGFDPDSGLRLG